MIIHTLVIVNFFTKDIPLCRPYASPEAAKAHAEEFLRGYASSKGFDEETFVKQMNDGEFLDTNLQVKIIKGDV